jgi:hypothetical protein
MAVPSARHRAVANEIKNKQIKNKKNYKFDTEKAPISEKEHEERMNKLRQLGLIK